MFEYLKPYCMQKASLKFPYNSFGDLYPGELEEAEQLLGSKFPEQLRLFYKEIGVGCILKPHIVPENYTFYNVNKILPPKDVANFSKGILRWDEQENWMSEATYELLEPGDLPFFEVGDSDYFLIMKPNSNNPNAVYDMRGHLIEDSFEKFIHNLYYDHPGYYTRNW